MQELLYGTLKLLVGNYDEVYYRYGDFLNGFEKGFLNVHFDDCAPRENEEFKLMLNTIVERFLNISADTKLSQLDEFFKDDLATLYIVSVASCHIPEVVGDVYDFC